MSEIIGAAEVKAKLKQIGNDAPKVVIKAQRAGAKVVRSAAQANAPVLSGFTRSQIKIRTSNKKSKGIYKSSIGVGKKDYKGDAFYAAFLMWGHKVGSRKLGNARKEVAPNDFLKRTTEQVGQTAADTVVEELKAGIEAIAAKGN